MEKHAVNLIITKAGESPTVAKLKVFLPTAAVVTLALFVIFFLSSIIYINKNNQEFTASNLRLASLEKRISDNKNSEGIYTLTVSRIKTIEQLSSGNKNFASLLSTVLKLQSNGISISQTTIDKTNGVTIAVTASSSAALDDFVVTLLKADASKLFSNIKSSGIVRDKGGSYLLSISLNPNPTLLQ